MAVGNWADADRDDEETGGFEALVVFDLVVDEPAQRRAGVGVATATGCPGLATSEVVVGGAVGGGGGVSSSPPTVCR